MENVLEPLWYWFTISFRIRDLKTWSFLSISEPEWTNRVSVSPVKSCNTMHALQQRKWKNLFKVQFLNHFGYFQMCHLELLLHFGWLLLRSLFLLA